MISSHSDMIQETLFLLTCYIYLLQLFIPLSVKVISKHFNVWSDGMNVFDSILGGERFVFKSFPNWNNAKQEKTKQHLQAF